MGIGTKCRDQNGVFAIKLLVISRKTKFPFGIFDL